MKIALAHFLVNEQLPQFLQLALRSFRLSTECIT